MLRESLDLRFRLVEDGKLQSATFNNPVRFWNEPSSNSVTRTTTCESPRLDIAMTISIHE